MTDKKWCNDMCTKNSRLLFGKKKIEAFCERVAIRIESGMTGQQARETTFNEYTARKK